METQEMEFFSKNQKQEIIIHNTDFRFDERQKQELKDAFLKQYPNLSKPFKIEIHIKTIPANLFFVVLKFSYQKSAVVMEMKTDSAFDFCLRTFNNLPKLSTNLILAIQDKKEEIMRAEARKNPWNKPSVDLIKEYEKAYRKNWN